MFPGVEKCVWEDIKSATWEAGESLYPAFKTFILFTVTIQRSSLKKKWKGLRAGQKASSPLVDPGRPPEQ